MPCRLLISHCAQGPNPAGPSGTVPHAVETQVAYIAKMLRKISSQRIKSMMPSKAATDDFVEYVKDMWSASAIIH